jgi:hypothetical protein
MCRFVKTAWTLLATPLAVASLLAAGAAPARGEVEPHYWRQPIFFIPYQPNLQDPDADKIAKVQLLISRDGGRQWAVLQEAEPHARGFSYHAAADGEYSFALRMADRRGQTWPETIAQPLLRVVVDTQPPTLELTAALDATGQVIVRYEAKDGKLKPETLRLEVQADGAAWQRLSLGPPDVSLPDRLLGQLAWRPPTVGRDLRFRAAIDDAAGNPGTAEASTSLAMRPLDPATGPQLSPPGGIGPTADQQAARPTLEWPTGGGQATAGGASDATTDSFAPPSSRTDAQLVADVAAPSLLSGGESGDPAVGGGADAWVSRGTTGPSSAAPAGAPAQSDALPWVNSLTFDVDYDIQTVGPWGVAKVELWGTRDGGGQWISLGVDQDNRSPMRVAVPGEGVYGFRIVVDGGNGAAAPPPQSGEQPEMSVGVDLQAPRAELQAAELGQGALAGTLVIRWSADDDRLAARPVGLFFGASAEGPWSTIATDLDNVGEYSWRLQRDAPPRVFLRLEVSDAAGNVAVQQSPTPVELNLPQPTGRLRSVRPVPVEPSRFRTAAGSRPAGG